MERKVVSEIMLILLFMGMLTSAFNISIVKADGTIYIYIRSTGEVDPPEAPIQREGNIYTFTDNIYDLFSIVVERDNIVVDGAGYTIQGTQIDWLVGAGIDLTGRSNVTVKNVKIKVFWCGIVLDDSLNNSIHGNNITNNYYGIVLNYSSNNTVSGNNITNNDYGIWPMFSSNNNTISGNNIADNAFGILLEDSSSNSISGNNITECGMFGISLSESSNNILSGNNVTNNSIGIWLGYSSNNSLSGNVMNNNIADNFGVWGYELSHFMHSIDVSNLADGKPVYYLANQTDLVISSATHPQVGYLALINCVNVTVEGLTLTENGEGLLLAYTNNSRITDNNIINNHHGVVLYESSNNTMYGNNITNNDCGIWLTDSSDNFICHNNFVDNTEQVHSFNSTNVWDEGYPSGGNYWSDFNCPDVCIGPYQNETGSDGIGDGPYIIDGNNRDRYPLVPYGYVPDPDLNKDGIVDISDIVMVALAFGSKRGDPNWNPCVDLNVDGTIDIVDIVIVTIHFGETDP